MHRHHHYVLQLDIQGTPQAWISIEHAAMHVATGSVAWVEGEGSLATLRGGFNVARGRRSVIDVPPIIALRGAPRVNLFDVAPAFSKAKLLRRDRMTCAYCGQCFDERDLQCEHIVPASRGGRWSWMNLVTACGACNGRKADRTPEEAGMPFVYLPLGSLCIACAVATEVFRADEAKDQAAVCSLHTRAVPTISAARKAPSRRVAPESTAGGVTRLVDIPISPAPRALPPIDSDSNAIRAGYAEAPCVPSRFEDFLLEGRHIRADVHEWLAARLPKGSRLS